MGQLKTFIVFALLVSSHSFATDSYYIKDLCPLMASTVQKETTESEFKTSLKQGLKFHCEKRDICTPESGKPCKGIKTDSPLMGLIKSFNKDPKVQEISERKLFKKLVKLCEDAVTKAKHSQFCKETERLNKLSFKRAKDRGRVDRELAEYKVLCEEQYPDTPCVVKTIHGEKVGIPTGPKNRGFGLNFTDFAPSMARSFGEFAQVYGQSTVLDGQISLANWQADMFSSAVGACHSMNMPFIGSPGFLGTTSFGMGMYSLFPSYAGGFCMPSSNSYFPTHLNSGFNFNR